MTALPPMPFAVANAAAAAVGGHLFVAGGTGAPAPKLQVFDGAAWRVRADLPAHRIGAVGAAFGSAGGARFAVFGGMVAGEGRSRSALMYDAITDAWKEAPPCRTRTPTARWRLQTPRSRGRGAASMSRLAHRTCSSMSGSFPLTCAPFTIAAQIGCSNNRSSLASQGEGWRKPEDTPVVAVVLLG